MKRFSILLLMLFGLNTLNAQVLVSADSLKQYTTSELVLQGLFSAQFEVKLYKLTYNTVDVHGNPTVASGAIAIPVEPNCDTLAIISYNHGTVLRKNNVPSRMNGEEFVGLGSATSGAVGVMPDYLGLGDNPGLHPYQHAESEATATVDMIRASREFIENSTDFTLNGQVFLTGYSQGGHAAMATHKYIQDNNLTAEFNVVASAPASGAYDMSETTADFIFNSAYSNPGYIVYLTEAYQEAYGNLYNNREEFYKHPYDTVILPYLKGDSSMDQLNAVLPLFIDSLIQDTVLSNFLADTINFTHPIRAALRDNDVYDWTPAAKIEMNYCENDEQVPYQNSLKTEAVMKSNGATDVSATSRGVFFNHGQCVLPSLSAIQDLFLSLVENCSNTIGISVNPYLKIELILYPNPVDKLLKYELSEQFNGQGYFIDIYTIGGKIVSQTRSSETSGSIDVSTLQSGMYFLRIHGNGFASAERFVIQSNE